MAMFAKLEATHLSHLFNESKAFSLPSPQNIFLSLFLIHPKLRFADPYLFYLFVFTVWSQGDSGAAAAFYWQW